MVFEALLRCGGNLVIPGTDKNSKKYAGLASEMGLIITHHHAEPLGAEMFARAYPGLWPSYQEYPEKFQGLWRDAIQRQKGQKVLWNIGFRGQGDRPFWEDDPRYATPEARGALMSSLIRMQYDLVKESDPDAELCTNLYGETMELYQEGCLKLPEDVIKIWADNGFGKMVTRRQGNHNPRIPALPKETDGGRHGLYYHVSFYDLQAANHITMLPNPPEFVGRELEEALRRGVRDYWIINCSNVKPHVYYLDYVAEIWKTGKADAAHQLPRYVETYYGKEQAGRIAKDFRAYWDAMTFYGEHEDERCGEQFANHVARMLACQYMKNAKERCEDLLWATAEETLSGQVDWYLEICRTAKERCQAYWRQCAETAAALQGKTQRLYEDSLLLQAKIHYGCFLGAYETAKSLLLGLDGDYKKAFYHAGKARKAYQTANAEMRSREHGKWHGFYENECLADIRQSAWVLAGLMNHFRVLGDGPHFYEWKREFLYSEEDRRVMLILTMENHMEDEELFALMEEKWEDESDE